MKFTLTLNCDNDAFSDSDGARSAEIARILRTIARRIRDYDESSGMARDRYGNTVGTFFLDEED